jgi:hypothetical protein
MNLTMIATVISAAAGFGLAWQLQAHQITKLTLEATHERQAQHRAAHLVKERQTDAVIQAQNAAAGRVAVLRRDADAARSAADGLRDDIEVASRAAATSIDACTVTATTYGRLLIASVEEYRGLAAVCSRHVSDIRTLVESWPK